MAVPERTSGNLTNPTVASSKLAIPAGFDGFVRIAGINSSGDMAGTIGIAYGYAPFVRLNGEIYDLMQLSGVPADAVPIDINDAGQIIMAQGASTILLLTPQPVTPVPPVDAVPVTIDSRPAGGAFTVTGAGCQPLRPRLPPIPLHSWKRLK